MWHISSPITYCPLLRHQGIKLSLLPWFSLWKIVYKIFVRRARTVTFWKYRSHCIDNGVCSRGLFINIARPNPTSYEVWIGWPGDRWVNIRLEGDAQTRPQSAAIADRIVSCLVQALISNVVDRHIEGGTLCYGIGCADIHDVVRAVFPYTAGDQCTVATRAQAGIDFLAMMAKCGP